MDLIAGTLRMLSAHTQSLYFTAIHCRRLRYLGLADESEACNVNLRLRTVNRDHVLKQMYIYFDYRKASEEYFTAQKLLEKTKRFIR